MQSSPEIATLDVLEGAPCSPAHARSYNGNGDVVIRVTFTDHSKALVLASVP